MKANDILFQIVKEINGQIIEIYEGLFCDQIKINIQNSIAFLCIKILRTFAVF